jgi:hypothetical protein
MTEREWLECAESGSMLRLAYEKGSMRKLRLLSCACIRTVWNHLTDPRSRAAVELAERYADGEARREEVLTGQEAAYVAAYGKRTWAAWSAIRRSAKR